MRGDFEWTTRTLSVHSLQRVTKASCTRASALPDRWTHLETTGKCKTAKIFNLILVKWKNRQNPGPCPFFTVHTKFIRNPIENSSLFVYTRNVRGTRRNPRKKARIRKYPFGTCTLLEDFFSYVLVCVFYLFERTSDRVLLKLAESVVGVSRWRTKGMAERQVVGRERKVRRIQIGASKDLKIECERLRSTSNDAQRRWVRKAGGPE